MLFLRWIIREFESARQYRVTIKLFVISCNQAVKISSDLSSQMFTLHNRLHYRDKSLFAKNPELMSHAVAAAT